MPITDPQTDVDLMIDRLVPKADYRGAGRGQRGYDRLVATWADARPFPTEDAVNAEQVIFLAENPRDAALTKQLDDDVFFNFLTQLTFDLENRVRAQASPPLPALTKQEYLALMTTVFRNTP